MKHTFPLALPPLLLVVFLCLTTPTLAYAESAASPLTALSEDLSNTETIPDTFFTHTGFHYLNRLVFRYEMVHFDTDSSAILPGSKWALHRKVRWLQKHPDATVVVEGHCDARGTSAYNKELGAQRAAATRTFLIKQGIEAQRIQVISLGKERPDVPGWGAHIWFYNRRVEFLPH